MLRFKTSLYSYTLILFDCWQAKDFCVFQNAQTGSGHHPVFYLMGTRAVAQGVRWTWCWSVTLLSHMPSWHGKGQLYHLWTYHFCPCWVTDFKLCLLNISEDVSVQVFAAIWMRCPFFWDVMPCLYIFMCPPVPWRSSWTYSLAGETTMVFWKVKHQSPMIQDHIQG